MEKHFGERGVKQIGIMILDNKFSVKTKLNGKKIPGTYKPQAAAQLC